MQRNVKLIFRSAASLLALLLILGATTLSCKPKQQQKDTLRVLYWNIQNGMWAEQGSDYADFANWVAQNDPDICIFCEASTISYDGTSTQKPKEERYLPDHWGELAARYGHTYWFKGAQRDNYPQVITSKYPIDSMGTFVGVEPDSLINHGAGWAQIRLEGVSRPLNIVSCHLKPFAYGYKVPKELQQESAARFEGDQYRRKEVQWILNHTVGTREHPEEELWLMAGDFNSRSRKDNFKYQEPEDSPTFMVHDFMTGATSPYKDLVAEFCPGVFCMSHASNRRIDYVYVTEPLLEACGDIKTEPDEYTTPVKSADVEKFWIPSDHLPIIVDFTIEKLK